VGLAIAHRIVQRHGGHIRVQAEPDAGARFEFALPAAVPAAELTAAEAPSNN
jgi:signal transduction histidine kinase